MFDDLRAMRTLEKGPLVVRVRFRVLLAVVSAQAVRTDRLTTLAARQRMFMVSMPEHAFRTLDVLLSMFAVALLKINKMC